MATAPARRRGLRLLRACLILTLGILLGWGTGSGAFTALWESITTRGAVQAEEAPQDPNRVRVDKDGLKHAPQPAREFRNASCGDQRPERHVPPSAHWSIPEIGVQSRITGSGSGGTDITLPAAPDSAIYLDAYRPGSTRGQAIIAGHVDYDDGRLSPWGKLHTVQPCTWIYITEPLADTQVYRVTDLYTLPQNELLTSEVFARGQAGKLFMVTCSGPSVGDNGEPFRFRYSHNLIVRAEFVDTIRKGIPQSPRDPLPSKTPPSPGAADGARGPNASGMGSSPVRGLA